MKRIAFIHVDYFAAENLFLSLRHSTKEGTYAFNMTATELVYPNGDRVLFCGANSVRQNPQSGDVYDFEARMKDTKFDEIRVAPRVPSDDGEIKRRLTTYLMPDGTITEGLITL